MAPTMRACCLVAALLACCLALASAETAAGKQHSNRRSLQEGYEYEKYDEPKHYYHDEEEQQHKYEEPYERREEHYYEEGPEHSEREEYHYRQEEVHGDGPTKEYYHEEVHEYKSKKTSFCLQEVDRVYKDLSGPPPIVGIRLQYTSTFRCCKAQDDPEYCTKPLDYYGEERHSNFFEELAPDNDAAVCTFTIPAAVCPPEVTLPGCVPVVVNCSVTAASEKCGCVEGGFNFITDSYISVIEAKSCAPQYPVDIHNKKGALPTALSYYHAPHHVDTNATYNVYADVIKANLTNIQIKKNYYHKTLKGKMEFINDLYVEPRKRLIRAKNPAQPAPAKKPAQPVVAPAKRVVAPAKPVAAPAKPVVAPAKPVVAPAKPVVAPAKPVAAPAKPVVAPAKPVQPPKRLLREAGMDYSEYPEHDPSRWERQPVTGGQMHFVLVEEEYY